MAASLPRTLSPSRPAPAPRRAEARPPSRCSPQGQERRGPAPLGGGSSPGGRPRGSRGRGAALRGCCCDSCEYAGVCRPPLPGGGHPPGLGVSPWSTPRGPSGDKAGGRVPLNRSSLRWPSANCGGGFPCGLQATRVETTYFCLSVPNESTGGSVSCFP